MSKIKFLAVTFLLISSVLFTSCEDEPIDPAFNSVPVNNGGGGNGGSGNGGGEVTTYAIKVTKDGVSKQWNTTQAIYIKSFGSLIIVGTDGSTTLNLSLVDFTEPGVFPLEFASTNCIYTEGTATSVYSSDYSNFETSEGNITVTELNQTNKTVKGTFNFTGKNEGMTVSKVFTKGEFFVKYTEQ
ncbi:DUF6252 family protein [Flavobacterium luteum]|uniref:Lipocalin-like domain-containing protein n=1 Tax=Flavobacterium luteum TaxID=2026654 RepID=A0A7J5AKU4_9FLAO|nr:DUF6252 family protein [Flavobacterium luteum]KAB1158175.1 hypothetical protein F6464_03580 [Flavobacterium luteum]